MKGGGFAPPFVLEKFMRFLTRRTVGATLLLPVAVAWATTAAFAADETAPGGAPTGPPAAHVADNGTPGAAGGAPQSAPAVPAQIDEAAKTLLGQISGTYKNLKTYAGNMDATITGAREKPISIKVQIAFQRPDKALVKRTDEQGTAVFAVDGKSLLVSMSQVKDKYLKRAIPPQVPAPADIALERASGIGPGLGFWLSGGDLVKETQGSLASLKVGEAAQIGGVNVDALVANLRTPRASVTFTFFAGHDDHLIRRVTMEQLGKDRTGKELKISGVEEHQNVQGDAMLVPSLLKFTPPAGAKPSDSLDPPNYDPRLKPGVEPFKFVAKDLAGQAISLDQYKGKVVLLDFWATWCQPCMMEMPNVIATYKKYHAQGFDIIGVSLDDNKAALTGLLQEAKIPWRQIFDGKNFEGAMPKLYGVTGIPLSIVIGRDGKIVSLDARGPELGAAVSKALAASSAKVPAKKRVAKRRR